MEDKIGALILVSNRIAEAIEKSTQELIVIQRLLDIGLDVEEKLAERERLKNLFGRKI